MISQERDDTSTMRQNSRLLSIPAELRHQILSYLLTPAGVQDPAPRRGKGIQTAVLCVNRALRDEGIPLLFSSWFRYPIPSQYRGKPILPPALRKMDKVYVDFVYETMNRGECAVHLRYNQYDDLQSQVERLALNLLEPGCATKEIHVELRAVSVRKAGDRAFKGEQLLGEMRSLLVCLAYLPRDVKVTVGGFDSVAFVDGFVRMRDTLAGLPIPWAQPNATTVTAEMTPRWEYGVMQAGLSLPASPARAPIEVWRGGQVEFVQHGRPGV